MVDGSMGEAGLIVQNKRDAVGAGDIAGAHNNKFVPRNARPEPNVVDAPARNGTPHGRPVDHARELQIVDIPRLASDFCAALLARDRSSHRCHIADRIARNGPVTPDYVTGTILEGSTIRWWRWRGPRAIEHAGAIVRTVPVRRVS